MSIALACPKCRTEYQIPDEFAGRSSTCRKCGTPMQVPAPANPRDAALGEGDWPDTGGPVAVQAYRRQATRSNRGLWVVLGLVVLLLAGGGVAGYWFFSPSAQLGDGARYLPTNTRFLARVRAETLMAGGQWLELETAMPGLKRSMDELEKSTGLGRGDIDEITIGWTMAGTEGPLTIIKTRRDISAAELQAHEEYAAFRETTAGKYAMYEGAMIGAIHRGVPAFCVPESRVLLLGGADLLRPVLERDGRPTFIADMQDRINDADFSRPLAFALNIKGLSLRGVLSGARLDLQDIPGSMVGVSGELVPGDADEVRFTFVSETVPRAEQLRKAIDGRLKEMKNRRGAPAELGAALDGVRLTMDDNRVRATAGLPAAAIVLRAMGFFSR